MANRSRTKASPKRATAARKSAKAARKTAKAARQAATSVPKTATSVRKTSAAARKTSASVPKTSAAARKATTGARKATTGARKTADALRSAGDTPQNPLPVAVPRKRKPRPVARRTRESLAARRERALRILAALRETYPHATCALRHGSAYELLVATILSAQCTDERVNQVTPNLFRTWPDAAALAEADPAELEAAIRSTGFYRNKTRSLLGMARQVVERHGGEIPDTLPDLLALPGVARKTANCVLGTWFGRNEGIVVDTHVGRVALRLRLLRTARNDKDAVRIEQDLMELFPRESWTYLAHALIEHGRKICTARKPKCAQCPLAPDCPSALTFG